MLWCASIYSYNSAYEDIVCDSLSPATYNIAWYKPVTIYTTAPMHVSHVIIHFYIQQHLFIRLSQFKNIFHQVGSYFHLVKKKKETCWFKHNLQVTMSAYTLDVISPPKEYFISTNLLRSWKFYWIFFYAFKNSNTHPQLLHISQRY